LKAVNSITKTAIISDDYGNGAVFLLLFVLTHHQANTYPANVVKVGSMTWGLRLIICQKFRWYADETGSGVSVWWHTLQQDHGHHG
jgi:hypothetical protein